MTASQCEEFEVPSDPRVRAVVDILTARNPGEFGRSLVVGCGSGREAVLLGRQLATTAIGIDIVDEFDPQAKRAADLRRGDATALEFEDASFDLVYAYHVLEHVSAPEKAVAEMRRVLKPGGAYVVGTPNRSRLLGYIGGGSSMSDKIRWNLTDWQARLTGRFRNEFGAHAGFHAHELQALLLRHFPDTEDVTLEYYLRLYHRHAGLVRTLDSLRVARFAFPSVYFAGRG